MISSLSVVVCILFLLAVSTHALNPNRLVMPAWAFSKKTSAAPGSTGKAAPPSPKKTFLTKASSKPVKLSVPASESIALYRSELKKSEKTDSDLAAVFATLTKTLGSEASAALCCKNVPTLLNAPEDRIKGNFAVYTEKFGEDKARGMVERNPSLLFIPTKGYGSAEVAGDDAMVMSYVIGYTRPLGKVLLGALGLALLKAIVFGVNV